MNDDQDQVVLVDQDDREIGVAEKVAAHREGKLHRAFSVFIFNNQDNLLLQKRADDKYHSGGLWSNTCCSHPRPGESTEEAAHRRLMEEMGFDCPLEHILSFVYHAPVSGELAEYEYDHVFIGFCGTVTPQPNPTEVQDWEWVHVDDLQRDLKQNPDKYSYWLREVLDRVIAAYREKRS